MSSPRKVSESTVRRLSSYLRILKEVALNEVRTISSEQLAELGGLTSAQVRKDLSFFGNFGVRGRGYVVCDLIAALRKILGLDRKWRTVVMGAGRLGSALTAYPEFENQGFHIVGVFDTAPSLWGRKLGAAEVRPVEELEEFARREGISIGIIATPASAAREAAERLVAAGIRGILNFAPTPLDLGEDISIRNVNLAIELEGLSFAIHEAESQLKTESLEKNGGNR
jgi:redox-sensing transcriptional repressor